MSCSCDGKNRITIVRGNDTNFNGQSFVHLNITSDVWDLSTMKATIALGGIKKEFEDLSNGIDLSYTAAETSKMPFGDIDGVLKVYNQEEQVATIESLLPFRVISIVHGDAIAVTPAEFNIEVKQGGETVMNIDIEAGVSVKVGSTTTLPAGSNATVTNSGTENHLVLDFGIPKGDKGDEGDTGPEGPRGPAGADGKNATINGVNTLTLTATYGLNLAQSGNVATLSGKSIQDSVTDEATNRSNADNNLQQQIDAIAASSDVTDIVGTHADLENYDTSKLKDNDIIKVLQDETEGGATTYYRWSTHTNTFTLIGEEGPYYTKGDADAKFVPQTRTINNKALSQNITLSASDVGAATAAQGAKADTAIQPNNLGSAAYEDTTAFATAAQGTKADTALQDATVDGTSVVNNGVAVIPNASGSVMGVVKLSANLTSVSDTIAATASMGNNLAKNIITGANTYSSSSTYSVGDKVRYGQYYYECITAITTAHAWNASEWQQITIQDEIDGKIGHGTSTTAAATVQKEVTISTIKTLKAGQLIIVTPTATSTAADSTLKLNDFDAYPMLYGGSAITTSTDSYVWIKDVPGWWLFDGSNWLFAGHGTDINTTYSAMSVANTIKGTETTARLVRSDYLKNGIFGVVTAFSNNATIALADKYLYDNNTDNITTLTLSNPSSPDNRYFSQVNFTSGSTATTFSYPPAFKVIDGCDDVQYVQGIRTFVPVANKRYQVFVSCDGVNVLLWAKGV